MFFLIISMPIDSFKITPFSWILVDEFQVFFHWKMTEKKIAKQWEIKQRNEYLVRLFFMIFLAIILKSLFNLWGRKYGELYSTLPAKFIYKHNIFQARLSLICNRLIFNIHGLKKKNPPEGPQFIASLGESTDTKLTINEQYSTQIGNPVFALNPFHYCEARLKIFHFFRLTRRLLSRDNPFPHPSQASHSNHNHSL